MLGRSVDFAPQPLGERIDPAGLGGYYCDLSHKAEHAVGGFPVDGFGEADRWVIPIAQAALGFWELRLRGERGDQEFLGLARWLLEEGERGDHGLVWRTDFPVAKYGLGPGWISAMGQGQAISVLLRAELLDPGGDFGAAADEALGALLAPVAAGGTQNRLDGVPVLEEYPTTTPTAVLNGWIFALFGLHELSLAHGEPRAGELFEASADGLVELLPRFDNGWWSLYSLQPGAPDLAKPFYQRLHPVLLDALGLLRPAPALTEFASRWRRQTTALGIARASLNKVGFRVRRALAR